MSSQQHLKASLKELGYFPSDNSEIPNIPSTCVALVSTLVDDISHAQTRISSLTADLEGADTKLRDLNLHLSSSDLTANKLANDNNCLRAKLLDLTAPKEDEEQWRQEKLVELEFLLGEYKMRCTALTEALENTGVRDYRGDKGGKAGDQEELDSLRVKKVQLEGKVEELERIVEMREEEIDCLETMLGKRIVANISDPAARLIFLEEHCRTLEQMVSGEKKLDPIKKTSSLPGGRVYETMREEIMTYKQQRDSARNKAARYKSQLAEALEELQLQTEKFEVLAEEFKRLIKLDR